MNSSILVVVNTTATTTTVSQHHNHDYYINSANHYTTKAPNSYSTNTADNYTTIAVNYSACLQNYTPDIADDIFSGEVILCALMKLPDVWKYMLGCLFLLMFMLASIQNGIVLVTLSQFAVLDTNSYKIQKCLVLTDFITGVTCAPLNALQLLLESTITLKYGYEVILWLQMVLVLIIINTTLFISYNRYLYQTVTEYQLSRKTVTRLLVVCWLVPLLTIALQLLGDAVKIIMWLATIEFSLNIIFIIHYTKETNKSLDNMTEEKLNKTETYHITRTIVVIVTLTVVLKSPVIINILVTLTTDHFHVEFYVIGNFICALSSVINPLIFGCMIPIRTHIKKLLSPPRIVHPEAGHTREVMQNKYLETCEYLDANPSPPPILDIENIRSVTTNALAYPITQLKKKRSRSTPASGVVTPRSVIESTF